MSIVFLVDNTRYHMELVTGLGVITSDIPTVAMFQVLRCKEEVMGRNHEFTVLNSFQLYKAALLKLLTSTDPH